MVAVVKEPSPSLTDWNTTLSVALDAGPCCTVCTSAAESVVESGGVATNGVGFGDGEVDVDTVVGTGPAMRTAEDVEDGDAALSAAEEVEDTVD